jgi:hypothetical protein
MDLMPRADFWMRPGYCLETVIGIKWCACLVDCRLNKEEWENHNEVRKHLHRIGNDVDQNAVRIQCG